MSSVQHPAARSPRDPSTLTPGYFAGVMGTGIVSIGAQLTGRAVLAGVLFWVAIAFYLTLVVLNIWRFARYFTSSLICFFIFSILLVLANVSYLIQAPFRRHPS